jgi:hypothetical protein
MEYVNIMKVTTSEKQQTLWSWFLFSLLLISAVWMTSCQGTPATSITPTSPTILSPQQTTTPISPSPTLPLSTPSPDISPQPEGQEFLIVVGIPEGQSLNLYLKPSSTEEIIKRIPAASMFIQPLQENPNRGDSWINVRYQESEGWADRSYLAVQQGSLPPELVRLGQFVTAALRKGDYTQLYDLIHPQWCLRFSPYSYLKENDQRLCPEELSNYIDSDTALNWGQYDGTGNPIQLDFQEYHERFIYDQDYFQPAVVGLDQEVSSGNAINNISEIYPDGIMIEYYFPGFDPQYGGMDWRSLRLVFTNYSGEWYLVALVHGEWTI